MQEQVTRYGWHSCCLSVMLSVAVLSVSSFDLTSQYPWTLHLSQSFNIVSALNMLVWVVLVWCVVTTLAVCPRDPGFHASPRTPGDGDFKITIGGDPSEYVPQSIYVVTLEGLQEFRRFTLVVDASPSDGSEVSPQRVGSYQLFGGDSTSTFNPDCINTVSETRDQPKPEVRVMWNAPAPRSGCVVLRAMVFVDEKHWYADDGQLSRVICELTEKPLIAASTGTTEECCACDQAKYKFIFEGLWSNVTHPKDFPFSLWLTHFSDVIGGSHGRNFTVWKEGTQATNALRQLAEWGSVRAMEQELRLKSRGLKTLIKAAGLWYPNVNSNTSSSFRVDRSKHLISLISMFGPSPDWVVGVSGLNLCLPNCTWESSKIIDLFPYDAGTDSGITYMSPNAPTIPQEPIHRITSLYPEDPRAPFYDPGGKEIPPLARLYITLDKLIPRSCSDKTEDELLEEVAVAENSEDSNRRECAVTEYSLWSVCSVTCGKGLRSRTRSYIDPILAKRENCDRQLISREMCVAVNPLCPGDEEELAVFDDRLCAVSDWESWSDCTATCGEGLKMRTRHFLERGAIKKCPHITLIEKEKCMEPPCTFEEQPDPECPVTAWSEWSPCSTRCGPGVRLRSRLLLSEPHLNATCTARRELQQQHPCTGRQDCVIDMNTAKAICMLDAEVGQCRGYFQRWFFSSMKAMCVPFVYSGCRGNRNNFLTEEDCHRTCSVVRDALLEGDRPPAPGAGAAKAITGPPVDCVMSAWSTWSDCSVTCGSGFRQKTRTVLVEPRNGGEPCPRTVSRRRRCHIPQEYCQ